MNTINKTETVSCVNWNARSEWERWTGNNRCPNCGAKMKGGAEQ